MPKAKSEKKEAVVCAKCHGYGYVIDEATNSAGRCDCGVFSGLESRARFENAQIPAKFAGKDFESFRADSRELKAIRDSAQSYAKTFNGAEAQGLLLRGGVGTGKTHIAVAIMKVAIEKGYTACYSNFSDLLSKIRDSYHEQSNAREGELLDLADSVDLLVLDDVGAESTTDWVRDRLYLIINRRYENARPVIITTNCSEDELNKRVGERTASRLYEMCPIAFPAFPPRDYRKAMMK
ncbi:hypothetical protein BH09SUM1_BH09SUM1_31750 [soil metagenome]